MPKPRITYGTYLKSEKVTTHHPSGAETIEHKPEAYVSQQWVRNYVDAVDFFESLDGTEVIRLRAGRIHVTSTSPGGSITREVLFTPIEEGPSL